MLAICIICTNIQTGKGRRSTHTDSHDLHLWLAIPAGSCRGSREREEGWRDEPGCRCSLLACDIFYECKSLFIRIWFTYLRAANGERRTAGGFLFRPSPAPFCLLSFSFTFSFLIVTSPFRLLQFHVNMWANLALVPFFIHSHRIFIHAISLCEKYRWQYPA